MAYCPFSPLGAFLKGRTWTGELRLSSCVGVVGDYVFAIQPASEGNEDTWTTKLGSQQEENPDEAAIAEPGAADEENVNEEYECISGLLDELGDQMGR